MDITETITKQFRLGADSIHGVEHWRRVEKMGLMLAEKTGADKEVVRLFAYLHDSKREDESVDWHHGSRAADFVLELHGMGEIVASEEQLEQLVYACRHHTDPSAKSDDITVLTCWDADRLDLWRVGILPDPKMLHSDAAREPTMIEYNRRISNP